MRQMTVACLSVAAVALSVVTAFAHPMDDAVMWMRGPVDVNGDGWLKTTKNNASTTDLPDALHIGDASDPRNTWTVLGPYNNIHIRTGCVPVPFANGTSKSASYLTFDQPVSEQGAYAGSVRAGGLVAVTNKNPHSVFMRFRVDSFMKGVGERINLMALGHSAGSGKGAGWKLLLIPAADGSYTFRIVNGRPASNGDETGVGTKDFTGTAGSALTKLGTNQWVDVVLTVGANPEGTGFLAEIYTCREGGKFSAESMIVGWNSTAQETSGTYSSTWSFAGPGGVTTLTPDTSGYFRGDIADIAVWNRRLSEDEARIVMAHGDVWRLGVANGLALEFTNGTATATATADTVTSFAAVPSAFEVGTSLAVNFRMETNAVFGLRQALRVRAVSGTGTFRVTVNDDDESLKFVAEDVVVSSAKDGFVIVPDKSFRVGANVLKLECVSADAPVVPDVISLGGSLSVGVRNDSHAEFGYTTETSSLGTSRVNYMEDGNWKHNVINLSTTGAWATNALYAYLDAGMRSLGYGYRFVFRGRSLPGTSAPQPLELFVNGVSKGVLTVPADRYVDAKFSLSAEDLVDGMNSFTLVNRSSERGLDLENAAYVSMDCRKFELSPDPKGLAIILK